MEPQIKIDSFLQRGKVHSNYNEDALFFKTLDDTWFVGAVMDGCSSGKDSYFASGLYAKSIQKSALTIPHLEKMNSAIKLADMDEKMISRIFLNQLFDDVKKALRNLLLEKSELLSTLILLIYNIKSKKAMISVSGDGFYSINGIISKIDQNNMPDFMGYHLDKSFDEWFANHVQSLSFENVNEAAIATDGIDKLFDEKKKKSTKINTVNILLNNPEEDSDDLETTYNKLISEHHLFPYDDLAIIKVSALLLFP